MKTPLVLLVLLAAMSAQPAAAQEASADAPLYPAFTRVAALSWPGNIRGGGVVEGIARRKDRYYAFQQVPDRACELEIPNTLAWNIESIWNRVLRPIHVPENYEPNGSIIITGASDAYITMTDDMPMTVIRTVGASPAYPQLKPLSRLAGAINTACNTRDAAGLEDTVKAVAAELN